jgi:hypothetical protein
MRVFLLTGLPALMFAVAACGGGGDNANSGDGTASTISTPKGSGGTATTIHLVIGGGPHAGTYDAKSDNLTCTYGFAGSGSWGNQYSVTDKKPNEFSSLQLIVPDTKDAADGTDRHDDRRLRRAASARLHRVHHQHRGEPQRLVRRREEGSGTIAVEDRGKSGKVTFKGKTKADVTLEGTIDCHQLMRGEG